MAILCIVALFREWMGAARGAVTEGSWHVPVVTVGAPRGADRRPSQAVGAELAIGPAHSATVVHAVTDSGHRLTVLPEASVAKKSSCTVIACT
jgi:hypothetical protein